MRSTGIVYYERRDISHTIYLSHVKLCYPCLPYSYSPLLSSPLLSSPLVSSPLLSSQARIYERAGVVADELMHLIRSVMTFGSQTRELERCVEQYYGGRQLILT